MNLQELNSLPDEEAFSELLRCCGSSRWVAEMVRRRPFRNTEELAGMGDTAWKELAPADWKEAFAHHPQIGDKESLRKKFASTQQWAEGEQSGINAASDDMLEDLANGNEDYRRKFGYIFIVFASGKSADEMLQILRRRLNNRPEDELLVAAEEQRKITRMRLQKLIDEA